MPVKKIFYDEDETPEERAKRLETAEKNKETYSRLFAEERLSKERKKNIQTQVYSKLLSTTLSQEKKTFFDNHFSFGRLLAENRLADSAIRHIRAMQLQSVKEVALSKVVKTFGQHVMGDFSLDKEKSFSLPGIRSNIPFEITVDFLRKVMLFAAMKANATILNSHFFEIGKGANRRISGVVVIAESHLAFHYFPEYNYFAIDVYTCGDLDTDLAVDYLMETLNLKPYGKISFKRGILGIGHRFSSSDKSAPDNSILPGIAIRDGENLRFFNTTSTKADEGPPIAHHCVGEFYCSDTRITNDGNLLRDAFCEAFEVEFAFSSVNTFEPQGVSFFGFTKDGTQMTCHPWPEIRENYLPVDVFTSSTSGIDLDEGMKRFAEIVHSERFSVNQFPRGVHNPAGQLTPVLRELTPPAENNVNFRK